MDSSELREQLVEYLDYLQTLGSLLLTKEVIEKLTSILESEAVTAPRS